MRRLALMGTAVALACVFTALAVGCGRAQSQWVKSAEVSSIIKGSSRNERYQDGRFIAVDVKQGGDVRFVVTVGAVGGYGATNHPKFYYQLLPAVDTPEPPVPVKLDASVTSQSVNAPNDVKTYDLRTTARLKPGTYRLLYDGAGSVRIDVYAKR